MSPNPSSYRNGSTTHWPPQQLGRLLQKHQICSNERMQKNFCRLGPLFRIDVCDLPLDVLDLICERCRIRGLCYNVETGGENECNAEEIIFEHFNKQ